MLHVYLITQSNQDLAKVESVRNSNKKIKNMFLFKRDFFGLALQNRITNLLERKQILDYSCSSEISSASLNKKIKNNLQAPGIALHRRCRGRLPLT